MGPWPATFYALTSRSTQSAISYISRQFIGVQREWPTSIPA